MEPVPQTLLLLPLVVLAVCVGMFGWIADTVFPEVWRTGEQFGLRPKRGERLFVHGVRAVRVLMAVAWLLVLVVFLFG